MEFASLIALLSALGIGGLIGSVIQSWLSSHNELKAMERENMQKRYGALVIQMITKLDPKRIAKLRTIRPDLATFAGLNDELKVELLNAMMFASDDVINNLGQFIKDPSYQTYFQTVKAMRQDLWKTDTKLNEQLLEEIIK